MFTKIKETVKTQEFKDNAKAVATGFVQGALVGIAIAVVINGVLVTIDNAGTSLNSDYTPRFYEVVTPKE